MSESTLTEEVARLAEEYRRKVTAIEERRARVAVRHWLRPRLRWLADHPRLLMWYLKLPHKTTVVATYEANTFGPAKFRVMRKADLP